MTVSRLKSKFLSRAPSVAPRSASYKNTIVWRWLQFVVAGSDETGDVIRLMRKRVDMPNQFPHRSYLLRTYLIGRCKLDPRIAERVHVRLWDLYAQYRDAELHNTSFDTVTRGVTRNPWRDEPPEPDNDPSKWLSR